jgi:Fe-S cluster assembly protein SufD
MRDKTFAKDWYITAFKQMERGLNGEKKTDFYRIRKEAINRFADLDFPTTKLEEWKYTNVSPIFKYNFQPSDNVTKIDLGVIEELKIKNLTENLIVFINGYYSAGHSKLLTLPKGVRIESFASVLKNEPDFLLEYFGKYVKIDNGFAALNTAMVQDGTVVYVPDNCVIDEPVQILNITASSEDSYVLSQQRNIIVAGKNSQIKIIETYNSLNDEPGFMNVVTEIDASENAYVELFRIQNENLNSFHISKTQVEQEKGSNFTSYNVTFGGSLVRNDLNTVLDEVNVNANLFGLYIIEDEQHVDNHTLIDHVKPNCLSNELYKGVLKEKSRAVFNGKVFVRKDAQKTNAYQSNKNILLSEEATVDTKPQLEIFADDVRCTHGATVGQLDDESVFYLRSRGIDEQNARSILIRAFANDIFEEIKTDSLREYLNNMVFEKLK